MQFPFRFACTITAQRLRGECNCTIMPLWVSFEVRGNLCEYSFLELEYTGRLGLNLVGLRLRKQKASTIRLKIENDSELKLCSEYLSKVVPAESNKLFKEDYSKLYRYEELEDRLSCSHSKIYTATNVPTKQPVLLRQLSLVGGETLLQVEIIMTLINRCSAKPLSLYIEKNQLNVLYAYFKGSKLEALLSRREHLSQSELKDFLVRMLFLLRDLEDNGFDLAGLSSDIVLLKDGELRNPVLMDFSCAQRLQPSDMPQHTHKLGRIAFELTMCTGFTQQEFRNLEEWTTGFTANYCPSLRMYDRRLFELVVEMVKNKKRSSELLKNPWLRTSQKRLGGCRLETILSVPLENNVDSKEFSEYETKEKARSPGNTEGSHPAEASEEETPNCSDEEDSATELLEERIHPSSTNLGDRLIQYSLNERFSPNH